MNRLNLSSEENPPQDEVYYLIEAKETLVELFQSYPKFGLFFLSPRILIHEESLHANLNGAEFSSAMKLLYLAEVRSVCARLKLDEYETVLEMMMGNPPFDESVFDRWWSLRRFHLSDQFENLIFRIDHEQFDLLAAPSEKIQAWIPKLQKFRDRMHDEQNEAGE